jgi:hypothetical protein
MSQQYYTTIGLEIHAELKTHSKMFCGCKNDPDELRPNVNVCPVCMAHPGTLPVINKEAVKRVIQVGLGGLLGAYFFRKLDGHLREDSGRCPSSSGMLLYSIIMTSPSLIALYGILFSLQYAISFSISADSG